MRIARFQNRVMAGFLVLAAIVVTVAWTHVLHPGPDAIRGVRWGTVGSPDGRSAYVATMVNRGDSVFNPVFVLDIASGQAQRLNSDPYMGPWPSADGGTVVWSEATPFFFRPLWRFLGGATSFRVRTSAGGIEALRMPSKVPDGFTGTEMALGFGMVDRVLPATEGDVFAIFWDRHLTFASRSRGELSEVNLGPGRPSVVAAVFLPSGTLRATTIRQEGRSSILQFLDIDPKSGSARALLSMEVGSVARVEFDATAGRALLTSGTGVRTSVSLVALDVSKQAPPTTLLSETVDTSALFLADGRMAASGGGWEKKNLRIFSAAGQPVLDVSMGEGQAPRLRGEMFPGVLAVERLVKLGRQELCLVETATGVTVRCLPDVDSAQSFRTQSFGGTPPPGSPAARLIMSRDGKLYELPSPTAEPRLLLPLSKP